LRRISILILILILLFTCLTNAFASSSLQKLYQVEDYFTVKLPDNLRVSISEKYHAITAMNGGIKQIITIKASTITQNFDDYVNDMQPRNPKSSLDGKGAIYIDNKEAQWLLFSYTESTKYYFLIYVIAWHLSRCQILSCYAANYVSRFWQMSWARQRQNLRATTGYEK
jgi:hypothetical protein